jgi:hypothetical protein
MSILLRDTRTGLITSTDLIEPWLGLYLRENPDIVKVGIALNENKNYYPYLNDSAIDSNDPGVSLGLVYNPGLNRLGINTTNPQATLDVFGNLNVSGVGTITKRFDVGYGGTVFTVLNSGDSNIVGLGSTYSGNVGIGSNIPTQKLDIAGSIKVDENIYDSVNYSGVTGYYLSRDINGIRWVEITPASAAGILVYNDLSLIGTGQSFFGINFNTGRGAGVNTDPVQAFVNSSNSNIADVYVYDYWDYVNGSTSIYRNSNVGINNSNPSFSLDVVGTASVTQTFQVGISGTVFTTTGIGSVGVGTNLPIKDVDIVKEALFQNTVELNSSLIDINNSTATGKFDYRLSSVGTGVSWRPSGVQTQNIIYVTKDGNDANSGLLEGDAKATVGAAASIAQDGDTIYIRPGVYFENNPIGLRTDVTVSGQDLRLVTIVPQNRTKDVFHVRRGCLIENLNFAGGAPGDPNAVSIAHTGCAAVAFPPIDIADRANTGYIAAGPTLEGPSGRWRSPYIRNCTNFMTKSIGMKIDGNHASVSDPINNIGNNLKCMVCDSFTQYNENGIGVSITNNGYAQLVSIFTINCDKGIYCDSGGSCDLTNSNSSFGNYGLYAVGLGSTEFTGKVNPVPQNFGPVITRVTPGVNANSDKVELTNVKDVYNVPRRPYDGQALFFQISNLDGRYPDAASFPTLTLPMVRVQEIKIIDAGSGYSASSPPNVRIIDSNDNTQQPKGPQSIIAQLSPTVDATNGSILSVDVISSGRNYLPTQNLILQIDSPVGAGTTATAIVITQPIYYTVDVATQVSAGGTTTVTFNERIPYELYGDEDVSLKRISRILTSSHSFEYIGTGTSINTSTPFQGAVPIKANEIVALDGAQVPFTSTDQKGNFDIGEGLQINQPTRTIRGRDFSRAIQAEVTPLILALR